MSYVLSLCQGHWLESKKKYHLEQLPFLQHTWASHGGYYTKSEAAFFGDMGFFGKMRGTKKRPSFAWRHEGDLRFWDILGRWLYKVKVGFFFYIFLLPDEVKDWSLCANWPLTLMERIHLEKDNLPRFVFFRLRHTVLLKRAKFKVCIMEKPL